MIAPLQYSWVPSARAASHREFVTGWATPSYRSVPSNLSVNTLQRAVGDISHVVTFTSRANLDAMRGLAGEDVDSAKHLSEGKDFLLEFKARVKRYDVLGVAQ